MSDKDEKYLDVTIHSTFPEEDHKYRVIMEMSGALRALRYGEEWRDLTGDKFVYCLAAEVERLRTIIEAVENCLVCAPIADPAEIIESTLAILKGEE